jgi:hypothetical protein
LAALAGTIGLLPLASASAKTSPAAAVRAEYRKVVLAEFFGPARAVCTQLTASGRRAYAGGHRCTTVFAGDQRALALKLGGGPGSSVARNEWRNEVASVLAHLEVKLQGRRASAIDRSGVFHKAVLVRVGRYWRFSSVPPLPKA